MIDVEQALARMIDAVSPLDSVEVALDQAGGRILRQSVVADRDFPPTDRSAMDGYALQAADLVSGEAELRLAGECRAGQPLQGLVVHSGTAVRIMTGAIVPPGADAVVMVERSEEPSSGGSVLLRDRPRVGQHIRRRGEDLLRGEAVLSPGVPLHAAELAALSSVGCGRVRVSRHALVHLLSTGDEIVEPSLAPAEHQVRNSNACTLLSQLNELGLEGNYLGIAGDERQDLTTRIRQGLVGDVLLITGGVSAGKYDLVAESLQEAGMRLLFHKVAMKPGKPILAGIAGSCLVVGLPGNPLSCYTGFAVLVAPVLRRMAGMLRWANAEVPVELEHDLQTRPGRTTYHLARIEAGQSALQGCVVSSRGSGDVLSMSRANGFLRSPREGGTIKAGTRVPALLWRDSDRRQCR